MRQAASAAIRDNVKEKVSSLVLSVKRDRKAISGGEKVSGSGTTVKSNLQRKSRGKSAESLSEAMEHQSVCRARARLLGQGGQGAIWSLCTYLICRTI